MRILSWNIQYGRAADGSAGLQNTLRHIQSMGKFDLICLQEVARNMDTYCEADEFDQVETIQAAFPDYQAVWGAGFSWPAASDQPSQRMEFGNLTLVRAELLDYKIHLLPMPAAPGQMQMQRLAVETVVNSATGPLSVLNMHLAFHDNGERQSQVAYICQLDADRRGQLAQPKQEGTGAYAAGYLPVARIACGDCNFGTDFDQYPYMLAHQWIDAWDLISSQAPRPNTCGIYDKEQWPEGPHTRDFFWLSQELADCGIDYRVDTATALSDHQPLMLEMAI